MVEMIALRELTGDYGHVERGDTFYCSEDTARSLETRENGPLAVRAWAEKMAAPPQNKMLETEENKVERIVPKKKSGRPRSGKRRK